MDVFVARQPIFDRNQEVVAYELLYRNDTLNRASISNPDEATADVFLATFMEIGLDRVIGNSRAFINMTRPFLVGTYPLPFSETNVTLEVLEDVRVDAELIASLKALSRRGYEIALDDFIYSEALRPLVALADVVKLDIRQLTPHQLTDHVVLLREFDVRLLAEKVETRDEYETCRELGFDLFQGYFFCKPSILQGKRAAPSRLATLHLLGKLNDPEFEFSELAGLIRQDATLVYKLLRFINSAYFNLPSKIDSIQHALVMLGQKNIRLWMTLIALSQVRDDNQELMMTTLTRARMCELLAVELGRELEQDKYFLAGLFSAIDAFIDLPMEEVMASLSLADDIKEGLLTRRGPIGETLNLILHAERGAWHAMDTLGLRPKQITNCYLRGLEWARNVGMSLKG